MVKVFISIIEIVIYNVRYTIIEVKLLYYLDLED